jgi:hypothetical protein
MGKERKVLLLSVGYRENRRSGAGWTVANYEDPHLAAAFSRKTS